MAQKIALKMGKYQLLPKSSYFAIFVILLVNFFVRFDFRAQQVAILEAENRISTPQNIENDTPFNPKDNFIRQSFLNIFYKKVFVIF